MIRFMNSSYLRILAIIMLFVSSCSDNSDPQIEEPGDGFFESYDTRKFSMGFTTWPFEPTQEAVASTDTFLSSNGDIYSEHIDSEIPWSAWMNDTELPVAFTDMVANRAARRTSENTMTLSLSLLNLGRNDLMPDFDGTVPDYNSLDDSHIENAYYQHVKYLVEQLSPAYLVIAVEVDGLLKHTPEKWEAFKSLMAKVKGRIKMDYPSLKISESVMLHGFYQPDFGVPQYVTSEVSSYVNSMDFAAISFYPFLKGLSSKSQFQEAFDFLHTKIQVPIAFAETGHLSEDLAIEGFDLFISGNQSEQNDYLQTLLINAQEENYEYVIWWTHRDYDLLWATFPEDLKDLGKIWISNGVVNEDGELKEAYTSWQTAFSK